eukprot:9469787-Pyramimonas_sp.AAC.1
MKPRSTMVELPLTVTFTGPAASSGWVTLRDARATVRARPSSRGTLSCSNSSTTSLGRRAPLVGVYVPGGDAPLRYLGRAIASGSRAPDSTSPVRRDRSQLTIEVWTGRAVGRHR